MIPVNWVESNYTRIKINEKYIKFVYTAFCFRKYREYYETFTESYLEQNKYAFYRMYILNNSYNNHMKRFYFTFSTYFVM